MKATKILMDEHRVIERVIDALETATAHLDSAHPVRPSFFLDAAEFIRGFADGLHHKKEEGVLFKAMVEGGMPQDEGPIAVMLEEHEQGRRFTRGMSAAAEALDGGDSSAGEAVVQNAQGYIVLLRQHIAKEDNVLFPMADRMFPPEEHERLVEAYKQIENGDMEEGTYQKYLDLAKALEKEAGG
jgi:hemerythrin-like domain-containing protein